MLPTSDDDAASHLFRHVPRPKTVSVIGAPMTYGQPFVGTDHGPRLLREAGLLTDLTKLGWRVLDAPDLNLDAGVAARYDDGGEPRNARHSRIVGAGCRALAEAVEVEIRGGRFPLILGGDHSVAIGSLAGVLRARPETGVIWVDAHADLNTPKTSPSGNLHGMPVGLIMQGMGFDPASVPGLEWLGDGGGRVGGGEGGSDTGDETLRSPTPPRDCTRPPSCTLVCATSTGVSGTPSAAWAYGPTPCTTSTG